jgi:hypothetical protein
MRDWLREVIQDAEISISQADGSQGVYQLQVLALSSRERALEVASDILAAYGRTRFEGSAALLNGNAAAMRTATAAH